MSRLKVVLASSPLSLTLTRNGTKLTLFVKCRRARESFAQNDFQSRHLHLSKVLEAVHVKNYTLYIQHSIKLSVNGFVIKTKKALYQDFLIKGEYTRYHLNFSLLLSYNVDESVMTYALSTQRDLVKLSTKVHLPLSEIYRAQWAQCFLFQLSAMQFKSYLQSLLLEMILQPVNHSL